MLIAERIERLLALAEDAKMPDEYKKAIKLAKTYKGGTKTDTAKTQHRAWGIVKKHFDDAHVGSGSDFAAKKQALLKKHLDKLKPATHYKPETEPERKAETPEQKAASDAELKAAMKKSDEREAEHKARVAAKKAEIAARVKAAAAQGKAVPIPAKS